MTRMKSTEDIQPLTAFRANVASFVAQVRETGPWAGLCFCAPGRCGSPADPGDPRGDRATKDGPQPVRRHPSSESLQSRHHGRSCRLLPIEFPPQTGRVAMSNSSGDHFRVGLRKVEHGQADQCVHRPMIPGWTTRRQARTGLGLARDSNRAGVHGCPPTLLEPPNGGQDHGQIRNEERWLPPKPDRTHPLPSTCA